MQAFTLSRRHSCLQSRWIARYFTTQWAVCVCHQSRLNLVQICWVIHSVKYMSVNQSLITLKSNKHAALFVNTYKPLKDWKSSKHFSCRTSKQFKYFYQNNRMQYDNLMVTHFFKHPSPPLAGWRRAPLHGLSHSTLSLRVWRQRGGT